MKRGNLKIILGFLLVMGMFLVVSGVVNATHENGITDNDQDGVADEDANHDNAVDDKCPGTFTSNVDQFGCSCAQKTFYSRREEGAQEIVETCAIQFPGAVCCRQPQDNCDTTCEVDGNGRAACIPERRTSYGCAGGAHGFAFIEPSTAQTWQIGETKLIRWGGPQGISPRTATDDPAPGPITYSISLMQSQGGTLYPYMTIETIEGTSLSWTVGRTCTNAPGYYYGGGDGPDYYPARRTCTTQNIPTGDYWIRVQMYSTIGTPYITTANPIRIVGAGATATPTTGPNIQGIQITPNSITIGQQVTMRFGNPSSTTHHCAFRYYRCDPNPSADRTCQSGDTAPWQLTYHMPNCGNFDLTPRGDVGLYWVEAAACNADNTCIRPYWGGPIRVNPSAGTTTGPQACPTTPTADTSIQALPVGQIPQSDLPGRTKSDGTTSLKNPYIPYINLQGVASSTTSVNSPVRVSAGDNFDLLIGATGGVVNSPLPIRIFLTKYEGGATWVNVPAAYNVGIGTLSVSNLQTGSQFTTTFLKTLGLETGKIYSVYVVIGNPPTLSSSEEVFFRYQGPQCTPSGGIPPVTSTAPPTGPGGTGTQPPTTALCDPIIEVFAYNTVVGAVPRFKAISNVPGTIKIYASNLQGTDIREVKTCNSQSECEYTHSSQLDNTFNNVAIRYYATLTTASGTATSETKRTTIGTTQTNFCASERSIVLSGSVASAGVECGTAPTASCLQGAVRKYSQAGYCDSKDGSIQCLYPSRTLSCPGCTPSSCGEINTFLSTTSSDPLRVRLPVCLANDNELKEQARFAFANGGVLNVLDAFGRTGTKPEAADRVLRTFTAAELPSSVVTELLTTYQALRAQLVQLNAQSGVQKVIGDYDSGVWRVYRGTSDTPTSIPMDGRTLLDGQQVQAPFELPPPGQPATPSEPTAPPSINNVFLNIGEFNPNQNSNPSSLPVIGSYLYITIRGNNFGNARTSDRELQELLGGDPTNIRTRYIGNEPCQWDSFSWNNNEIKIRIYPYHTSSLAPGTYTLFLRIKTERGLSNIFPVVITLPVPPAESRDSASCKLRLTYSVPGRYRLCAGALVGTATINPTELVFPDTTILQVSTGPAGTSGISVNTQFEGSGLIGNQGFRVRGAASTIVGTQGGAPETIEAPSCSRQSVVLNIESPYPLLKIQNSATTATVTRGQPFNIEINGATANSPVFLTITYPNGGIVGGFNGVQLVDPVSWQVISTDSNGIRTFNFDRDRPVPPATIGNSITANWPIGNFQAFVTVGGKQSNTVPFTVI